MSELRRHNLIMSEDLDDDEGADQICETHSRRRSGSILHKYLHSVNNSRSIKSYRQHSHINSRDEFYENNRSDISECDITLSDNEERHQQQMALLPPDTYSFMMFVPLFSPAFFLAICVRAFHIIMPFTLVHAYLTNTFRRRISLFPVCNDDVLRLVLNYYELNL